MHIQKVLNSSVVLVQDDSGEESILLGKGIGYGRKAGEPIERQPSDRVFLPLSNPDAQPMLELFSSIPAVYLDLTQDIVDDAEQSLGVKLSAHIYLLLTDHLHFAVERQQKGLVVTNRIFWEIKHFYPSMRWASAACKKSGQSLTSSCRTKKRAISRSTSSMHGRTRRPATMPCGRHSSSASCPISSPTVCTARSALRASTMHGS